MSTSGLTEDNSSNMVKDFKMVVDQGFAKCEERLDRLEADFIEIKTLLQKLLAKRASSTQESQAKPPQSGSLKDIKEIFSRSSQGNSLQQPQQMGQPKQAPPIHANEKPQVTEDNKFESGQTFDAACNPQQPPQQMGQLRSSPLIISNGKPQANQDTKLESRQAFDAACLEETNEIIKSYENNELPKYLSKQSEKREPKAFSKNSSTVREGNPDSVLTRALEKFLTRSEEPDKELEALKNANPPQVICRKQRKWDDESYSCIDCALFSTCGLCSECFHKSIHRKHRYEVVGHGFGYCDCGEFECWKDGHACDLHKKTDQSHEPMQDPQNILKIEMKQRAERLFEAVMSFSHKALTSSEDESISASVDSLPGNKSLYCTMISSSALLTSDQVLNILINILTDCNLEKADAIIAELKENGRTCIHKGEKSECEKLAKLAVEESTKIKRPGLEVKVMNYKALAEQDIAHELLQWMKKIVNISDGFTSIFFRIMIRPCSAGGSLSLIEKFLLDDTKISTASRLVCHQLYSDPIIRNKERRAQFAGIFFKHYPALVSSLLKAKHHIASGSSVISLTYMLYVPSSVTKEVVVNHKAIEAILNTILTESKAWQDNGTLLFKDPQDIVDYGLVLQSFYDLNKILSWCLISFEWTDESRSTILNGLDLLLKFMSLVQEMDLARLPLRGNKERETLHAPFVIQHFLKDCSNLFVKLCSSDWEVHRRSYSMVLDRLSDRTRRSTTINIRGHTAECFFFDVHDHHNKTTIFLPIHRLFAALYIKLPDGIVYTSECFASSRQKISLSDVLEYPLRVLVRHALVEAQVWNGKSHFVIQMLVYKRRLHNEGMFDRDIQILQIAASLMEPNEFMIHILNKFNLTWLLTDSAHPTFDYTKKHRKYFIDKFFLLLIHVVGERFVEGIGIIDQDTALKRDIVHTLAISDRSLSDLKKKFSVQIDKKTNFEENLKTVARVGENSSGEVICKLRSEYYDWFNPCFHHYRSLKQGKAEVAQRKIRKDKGLKSALSIPKPPTLCKKFESILGLLKCEIMLQIMSAVVSDVYHKTTKVFKKCHLEKVLHLMTIGFHEDKSLYEAGDISLPFVKTLQETKVGKGEKIIMDLLQQYMNEKVSSNHAIKDLCEHVLGVWRDLLKLQNPCTVQ